MMMNAALLYFFDSGTFKTIINLKKVKVKKIKQMINQKYLFLNLNFINLIKVIMIKHFNYLLKGKFIIESSFLRQPLSFNAKKACEQQRPNLCSIKQLLETVSYDTSHNFLHYTYINNQFQHIIKTHHQQLRASLTNNNDPLSASLSQTFSLLSQYPLFALDNDSLKLLYQLIIENIHVKDPRLLENALLFMAKFDQHVQKTKLYEEFARFYVNSKVELIRGRFSLQLQKENVIGSIKKLIFGVYQRGFFPRTPGYTRTLSIRNNSKLINILSSKPHFHNSLILKRANYESFQQIKQFYEHQMKQNLYHQKNTLLLNKLTKILPTLCQTFQHNIHLIEPQCRQLRQLYVKLFLVISNPSLKGSMIFYDLIKKNQTLLRNQNKDKLFNLSGEMETKQNQDLHSQTKNKININKNTQSNDILAEFMKKVENSFAELEKMSENQVRVILKQLTLEEFLLFLSHLKDFKVSYQFIIHQIIPLILAKSSPIMLHCLLSSYLNLLTSLPSAITKRLQNLFQSIDNYELLTLEQLAIICNSPELMNNRKVKLTVLQQVGMIDIKEVGAKQLMWLLQVYKKTKVSQSDYDDETEIDKHHRQRNQVYTVDLASQINSNRQPIINFTLRFLADHHTSFQFDQHFQRLLEELFNVNEQKAINQQTKQQEQDLLKIDFNDKQNNYPFSIFPQITNHLKSSMWKIKNQKLKLTIQQRLSQIDHTIS